MAHTPGPWQWRHVDRDDRRPPYALEVEGNGDRAAVLQIRLEMDPEGKIEAYFDADDPDNLRLIAAAPELLRCCRLVREGLENLTTQEFFEGRVEALRDLLAETVDRALVGHCGGRARPDHADLTPSFSKKNFT